MNSSFRAQEQGHLKGDTATHRLGRAGARHRRCFSLRSGSRSVIDLSGRSQARGLPSSRCPGVRGHTWSRNAQPCRPQSSQRLAFFALSKCARAHLEPQRSPCRPQSSHRLAFFALSKCARAHLEPQRSALPVHPSAAHLGASNCGFQVDAKQRQIAQTSCSRALSHSRRWLRAGVLRLTLARHCNTARWFLREVGAWSSWVCSKHGRSLRPRTHSHHLGSLGGAPPNAPGKRRIHPPTRWVPVRTPANAPGRALRMRGRGLDSRLPHRLLAIAVWMR